LNVRRTIQVYALVRMAVPRQELPDPQRIAAVRRAEQHHIAEPAVDQPEPTEDEGPHDYLAQLGIRLHERHQVLAVHLYDRPGTDNAGTEKGPPPGEQVGFPAELTGTEHSHRGVRIARRSQELHLPCRYHEEGHDLVARFGQHLALPGRAHPPMAREALDLRRCQRREHLVHARRERSGHSG
jgi:hypothetical protein